MRRLLPLISFLFGPFVGVGFAGPAAQDSVVSLEAFVVNETREEPFHLSSKSDPDSQLLLSVKFITETKSGSKNRRFVKFRGLGLKNDDEVISVDGHMLSEFPDKSVVSFFHRKQPGVFEVTVKRAWPQKNAVIKIIRETDFELDALGLKVKPITFEELRRRSAPAEPPKADQSRPPAAKL